MALTRRLDALVSHQLRRWEESARRPGSRPCIAIANLPGAGGEEVGRRVAEALGYGCFDREIVDTIAQRRGLSHELLDGLDERVRSAVERYVTDAFREHRFTESDYLREIARLVATLSQRGMSVIVGRGAAFLLTPAEALRVLLVAPFEIRGSRFAGERRLAAEAAVTLLREEDARRTAFIREHFGARIDDPLAYDLVLNTATLGLEAAAAQIVDAFRRRFPGAAAP